MDLETSASSRRRTHRLPVALALLLGAGMVSTPLWRHSDDGDAQLYRVVVRNIVETGDWLDLQYLPQLYPRFREHLPFGFWPYAAVVRVAGERALDWAGAGYAIAVLAVTAWLALRRSGPWAAVVAVLVLATNDSVYNTLSRARLDTPMVLFALLASAPFLLGWRGARAWLLAASCGAVAVAIKGPFGAVPLAAAATAQAISIRSWRPLLAGALAGLAALVPFVAFLVHDRSFGDGSWWSGYVQQQLFASAAGVRRDGVFHWWFPFAALGGRFWPGLPLVLAGAVLAVLPRRLSARWAEDPRTLKLLALNALIAVGLLLLPARKLWFHLFVAFPALALLAGASVGTLLDRALAAPDRLRRAAIVLALLAVAPWAAHVAGITVWAKRPFVFCAELGSIFAAEPAGTPAVVIGNPPWDAASTLAAEFRWSPRVVLTADPAQAQAALGDPVLERYALVQSALISEPPAGWSERGRARGWTVLQASR